MAEEYHLPTSEKIVSLKRGDITIEDVDSIVNAANPSLMGGGGVDGAIHLAAGPSVLKECLRIISEIGRLEPGNAIITTGGNLKAKYIIHTVGPIWNGGNNNEAGVLESAYFQSLKKADEYLFNSVAFPSISTGAYGYPVEKAARIALDTVCSYLRGNDTQIQQVKFLLFDRFVFEKYVAELNRIIEQL